MAEEWNIGDRAWYRDIGGKKDIRGEVVEIAKAKNGNIKLIHIKGDDGRYLFCKPRQLIKIRKRD